MDQDHQTTTQSAKRVSFMNISTVADLNEDLKP